MQSRREVQYTSEFKRNVRQLVKKYRHIKSDLQPLIERLEFGETPGDRITGIHYVVYKVRVQNSDIGKGKRSGYRLVYYLKTSELVVLVTIYAKNEQGDISPERVRQIIAEFDTIRGN